MGLLTMRHHQGDHELGKEFPVSEATRNVLATSCEHMKA